MPPRTLIVLLGFGLSQTFGQPTYTPYSFTTIAGLAGGFGWADGVGIDARFSRPEGVATDKAGNVYIADSVNYTVRKITPDRVVSTLAGQALAIGTNDGPGLVARFGGAPSFAGPNGIAVDSAGNVFVSDTGNKTIRKITPEGIVSTIAGAPGSLGLPKDGTNNAAKFDSPRGLAVDGSGNIFVLDGYVLRKISPVGTNWVTTTIAGSLTQGGGTDGKDGEARFGSSNIGISTVTGGVPKNLVADPAGNIFIADTGNATVRQVSQVGTNWVVSTIAGLAEQFGFVDGFGSDARFSVGGPYGIAIDDSGALYVSDPGALIVRKITRTFAGWAVSYFSGAGVLAGAGSEDGPGIAARFGFPTGMAADSAGNLYVADFPNAAVRKVTPGAAVSTFAGRGPHIGAVDGKGADARFHGPSGVTIDTSNNLFVSDAQNHTIRKIASDSTVTTIAGTGKHGTNDGPGLSAKFENPQGIGVDNAGNIYVADFGSSTIRKIAPGTAGYTVSTIAGLAGITGTNDGVGDLARFNQPFGLTLDKIGNLYIADTSNLTIRKLTQAANRWTVTTFAGTPGRQGILDGSRDIARLAGPIGVVADADGNIYMVDGASIRKANSDGDVTTLAGCPSGGCTDAIGMVDGPGEIARFGLAFGITLGSAGELFVTDPGNFTIRKLTLAGAVWNVTTLGGVPGQNVGVDGVGMNARFGRPQGIAADSSGNIYIADKSENRVVKGSPAASSDIVTFDLSAGKLELSGGVLHVFITGPEGRTVVIEQSADLKSWSPLDSKAIPAGGLALSLPATDARKFFRVYLE
jgi:sugar lactone lactonase YvrE